RVDAERGLVQVQFQAQDRVGAGAGARARAARGGRAEEGVHDVREADERPTRAGSGHAPGRGQRVPTEVDDLPFGGVGKHLVGRVDLLEALLRGGVRIDVRV